MDPPTGADRADRLLTEPVAWRRSAVGAPLAEPPPRRWHVAPNGVSPSSRTASSHFSLQRLRSSTIPRAPSRGRCRRSGSPSLSRSGTSAAARSRPRARGSRVRKPNLPMRAVSRTRASPGPAASWRRRRCAWSAIAGRSPAPNASRRWHSPRTPRAPRGSPTVLEAQRTARDAVARYVDDLATAQTAAAYLRLHTLTATLP